MIGWAKPVALVNARVVTSGNVASSIRFDDRVLALGEAPRAGDAVIDLGGAFVVPGLINAHDHLELNHYGRLAPRERYDNATAWIDDLRPMLRADADIRRNSAHPLGARLFIGGLKNVLAGVTTVAHHNPRYREIRRRFPVRVVERYGWAHSLAMANEPVGARGEPGGDIRDRYRHTPRDAPFMVHVGEGVDEAAAAELARLDALGCVGPNTVLVHGVAFAPADCDRLLERGASVVWCPSSNLGMFGRTFPVRRFLDASTMAWAYVALGTDSRVSGARDLLDELRVAASATNLTPADLLRMVTIAPARMLRLESAGTLEAGAPADLTIVPPIADDAATALLAASRRDLRLVMIGGRPVVGAPEMASVFMARRVRTQAVTIDGEARIMASRLARAAASNPIPEPGLSVN